MQCRDDGLAGVLAGRHELEQAGLSQAMIQFGQIGPGKKGATLAADDDGLHRGISLAFAYTFGKSQTDRLRQRVHRTIATDEPQGGAPLLTAKR